MLAKKLTSMPTVCMPLNAIWTSELARILKNSWNYSSQQGNNTEALMDELEGWNQHESTNRLLGIFWQNDMNDLEESDLSNCTKCYFNRAVIAILEIKLPVHLMIMCKQLWWIPYIFEREYDYAASFVIQMLWRCRSWSDRSLCHFVWKTREQIALSTKTTLGGRFFIFNWSLKLEI